MPAMACSDRQTRLLLHPERDAARHPRGLFFRNSATCRTPPKHVGAWSCSCVSRSAQLLGLRGCNRDGREELARAGKSMPYVVLPAVPSSPILPSAGRCGTSGGPLIPTASPAPQPLWPAVGDAAPKHPTQDLNLDDDPAATRRCPVILNGLHHAERHSWTLYICYGVNRSGVINTQVMPRLTCLPLRGVRSRYSVIGWACG